MKLPRNVIAAINTYYAFQGRARLGVDQSKLPDSVNKDHFLKGLDESQQGWKDVCLKAIDAACTKHSIGLCAAAGTFFLVKGRRKAQVSHPILPGVDSVPHTLEKKKALA